GGALTLRIWSIDCPRASFPRTISAWRSTLRNADTILISTPSACAASFNEPHARAAGGTRRCCLPSSPVSATTSTVASGYRTRERAVTVSSAIPSEASAALTCSGHSLGVIPLLRQGREFPAPIRRDGGRSPREP